jgi:polyisoprenoid-binding protein YceI
MRRVAKWIIGGIVGLAVLVVVGTYVFIHFIEGDAPAALDLRTESSSAASSGPAPEVPGTWKATGESLVGYRVKEVLFGQDAIAVGRTSDVTGTVKIDGTTVSAADFSVDLTTVSSDKSQRDSQFQGRIMETSQFPTATFTLTEPIDLGTVPSPGKVVTYDATGDLTLHGVTKTVSFQLSAKREGSTLKISGSIPVTFADYDVANPSFGPVTTEDHGTMEFLLVLEK